MSTMLLKDRRRAIRKVMGFFKRGFYFPKIYNYLKYLLLPKREILTYGPLFLNVYISDRCNYSCIFCHHHSKFTPNDFKYKHQLPVDMNLEAFKIIIDTFPSALSVLFCGVGESLLNKDVFHMIDYAHKRKMRTILVTNGDLLMKYAEFFFETKLNAISISLNAIEPSEHMRLSGLIENRLDSIASSIKKLVYLRNQNNSLLEIKISFVVHRDNYNHMIDYAKFCEALGVDTVYFQDFILPGISGYPGYSLDKVLFDDQQDVIDAIAELLSFAKKELRVKVVPPFIVPRKIKRRKCLSFFSELAIDAYGNVTSCGANMTPQEHYGNVFKEKQAVWNNQYMQNLRQMFLDNSVELLECCQFCRYIDKHNFK